MTNKQNGNRKPIDWIVEYIQGADITTTTDLDESTAAPAEGSETKQSVQIIRHTAADDERVGVWDDLENVPGWIDADADLLVSTSALWDYLTDDVEPGPEGA